MNDGKTAQQPVETLAKSLKPDDLIRAAQEHAQRLCELALTHTPPRYHSFIVLMEQRKRVGGSDPHPLWAEMRLPYLSVDGRVRMAIDEHEEAGKQIHIETSFVMDETTGQPLARATVKSELRGTAVAHARIFLNGSGANKSNPVENGETSAVGRALGFLGYGCFGTGIASAEEVLGVARPADPAPAKATGALNAVGSDHQVAANTVPGKGAPPKAGVTSLPESAPARSTPTAPSVFSAINALFDRQKTPGAGRVALMKEYRGREGELLRILESSDQAPLAPAAPPAHGDVTVDADEVPF